ncbi:hypothetical protein BASA81_001645 [Batrachochytrium salamandrivorans]|nr:hypothetical protein BASA81_001645 [Batrachochytrium salamandrivorans]
MLQAQKLFPGLAVAFTTSQVGFLLANELGMGLLRSQGVEITAATQSPISGIPVGILLGVLANKIILERRPDWEEKLLKPGLTFATKPVLQTGIVCVGAKLSFLDLFTTGLFGFPCVAASVFAGMTLIPKVGKQLGVSDKMSSLIAAGTSICGVTAISAVAPAIKAEPKDSSFAIANVVAFGTLGMLTMPYLAHYTLGNSQQIGLFLGLSVHDTSQVIGSALTYSSVYGDELVLKIATITKLSRNILLAGVVPYLSMQYNTNPGQLSKVEQFKKYTPQFVFAFVGMSLVRSVGDFTLTNYGSAFGVLDPATWKQVYNFVGGPLGTQYLLGTALAGVGLQMKLSQLKGVGYKPFLVGLSGAGIVAGTGFASASVMGAFL